MQFYAANPRYPVKNTCCAMPMSDGGTCPMDAVATIKAQPLCARHIDRVAILETYAVAVAILTSGELNGARACVPAKNDEIGEKLNSSISNGLAEETQKG